VLIADFVAPTFHSWNLPAAIVIKLISLLSSIRRTILLSQAPQEMPAEREAGREWLMSHKLGWVAAS
jgi:hypothetical protein